MHEWTNDSVCLLIQVAQSWDRSDRGWCEMSQLRWCSCRFRSCSLPYRIFISPIILQLQQGSRRD